MWLHGHRLEQCIIRNKIGAVCTNDGVCMGCCTNTGRDCYNTIMTAYIDYSASLTGTCDSLTESKTACWKNHLPRPYSVRLGNTSQQLYVLVTVLSYLYLQNNSQPWAGAVFDRLLQVRGRARNTRIRSGTYQSATSTTGVSSLARSIQLAALSPAAQIRPLLPN